MNYLNFAQLSDGELIDYAYLQPEAPRLLSEVCSRLAAAIDLIGDLQEELAAYESDEAEA